MNDHELLNDLYGLTFDEAELLARLEATPRTLRAIVLEPSAGMQAAYEAALGDGSEHWDLHFAADAAELRDALASGATDVLLAGVDAVPALSSLLTEVELRDPEILRVVIGRPGADERVLATTSAAHRFVAAPFDVATVLDDLARTLRRREVVERPEALRLALGDATLPASPGMWVRLSAAVEDPEVGAAELGRIVETNVAVTAKALQLANSAWFGLPRRVSRIEDAVILLGGRALLGLVLAAEVSASLGEGVDAEWLVEFEQHAAAVARAAAVVAPAHLRQEAVAAALLHDIGTLVLMRHHPEVMRVAVTMPTIQRLQLERDLVGATHAEIGGLLLDAWGLPEELVDAVLAHHAPWVGVGGQLDLGGIVHVADALVRDPDAVRDLGLPHLDRLGLDGFVEPWLEALAD